MTTSTTSESSAAAPLFDLQALVVAVRRRRRLWCAMGLLGLLVGAAVAVLLPPPPSAVTKVLVAHAEDQPNDTGTLIRTDVEVLGTTRIAGKALRSLKSSENPEDFMRDYRGTGLTNNLLQIDVTGDSDADAVARAKALADAFVADHVRRMRETAKAEADALLDQRDRMRDELAQVNQEIGDRSPESDPKASASIESLFARRAELNSRIADFDQRAAEARTGTPKVVAGTQIVDAPRAVRHSLPKAAVTNAAIGLVLGLVLGLALAAVRTVVADRPVLRRDIAANLGASVIAELPRHKGRLWQRRRTRATRERLTATLARTVRGSAEPVSLLELGCARSTSVIALNLAGALAADGPVVIVDGLPGPQLATRRPKPGDPTVVSGERAADVSHQERRIGVGSVAPGTAWTDLQYLGTQTVLVVRAGHGSAAWLHTVARQLADQRIAVIGVVLIDPDPRDRTDGTLWDGLHTALRGRSERPARHNGGGTSHAVQAVGEGQRRPERQPAWAARVPDDDQEAR
ncbi:MULTISPECIES: Wzz/FepE/Etk N-terminal domain-containing protein [unclassified Streptomyces]|uniref:Wzz/FepE/Etk N-terminal domain-containing protein n=1 Tax=unclassified Streptomyces TaxID=2593676 RepID=UPI0023658D73|nr:MULTISPECIES: Wzz/FepE/Etk N-terminal domain-containing protein [unclassified Streptomyces]MDF3143518.1 Wzz/FepE/Etk N-terminal domain-containing protein [Streptomyces sp. T21Q-yed]WDF41961.1 Wzz/FepE/Etk N-terminal domain-containing protein [Streptomyces sp. T12]